MCLTVSKAELRSRGTRSVRFPLSAAIIMSDRTQVTTVSVCAGIMILDQNIRGQNIPEQNIPGQNIPDKTYPDKTYRSKYIGQKVPGQR